jgi:hypothetical protein
MEIQIVKARENSTSTKNQKIVDYAMDIVEAWPYHNLCLIDVARYNTS